MNPDTLRRMFASGLTQAQIARALGVSDTAVYLARKRHGIAYTGQQGPAPILPREAFCALWGRMKPREVAEVTGCNVVNVYARARRLGLPVRRAA